MPEHSADVKGSTIKPPPMDPSKAPNPTRLLMRRTLIRSTRSAGKDTRSRFILVEATIESPG